MQIERKDIAEVKGLSPKGHNAMQHRRFRYEDTFAVRLQLVGLRDVELGSVWPPEEAAPCM